MEKTKGQELHAFTHAEAEPLLRRAGYSKEQIEELLHDLPDPIDPVREAEALAKRGMSMGAFTERMGGSP